MPAVSPSPLAAQLAMLTRQRQQMAESSVIPIAAVKQAPEVQEWFKGLLSASHGFRNSVCMIAYYGIRLKDAGVWQELGFQHEADCIQQLGIPEKIWAKCLVAGERLRSWSLEEVQGLGVLAIDSVAKVHPKLWNEYSWLDEVQCLPNSDFMALVEQRNREAKITFEEPLQDLRVNTTASRVRSLRRKMDLFRHQWKVSQGVALERALDLARKYIEMEEALEAMEDGLAQLDNLWSPDTPWSAKLKESQESREKRLEDGTPRDLEDAALLSQWLVKKILRGYRSAKREVG